MRVANALLVSLLAACAACAVLPDEEAREPDESFTHEGTLDVVGPGPFDPSRAIDGEPPAEEESAVTPPAEVSEEREQQEAEIAVAEEQGHTEETQERIAESPPRVERRAEDSVRDRVVDVGLEGVLVLVGAALLTLVVQLGRSHPLATAVGCAVIGFASVGYVVTQLA